ncbi:unnamed protein product [Meloidogyne enterolobii]|uniref:Uncharacterized protein n=1 Tax=Meloidogyne enterolobii TaxID=390850 RepID=A0ACB1B0N0_MELEN
MNILLWTFFLKGIGCFEKMGWMEELSSSVESWGYKHLEQESAPEFSVDDIRLRAFVLREGRMPRRNTKNSKNNSHDFEEENKLFKKRLPIEEQQLFTGHRRLVEEILESYDPTEDLHQGWVGMRKSQAMVRCRGWEESLEIGRIGIGQVPIFRKFPLSETSLLRTELADFWNIKERNRFFVFFKNYFLVHPRRDFRESTRVNLSMSLYQILEVDERKQSIVVNVWMFLDWDPNKFEMINKTIVPYQQIWVPDTMDRRSTEALMNAIVENCSFIISSWTHDSATINYHYERPTVNLLNFAQNDEWTVISFNFERIEQQFKCCKNPWTMLYAHLSIWYCPHLSLQSLQSLDFLHLLQAAAKEMKSFIWELIL